MTKKPESFEKTVWDTLSALDVSKHVQKKMNLSYLSWAWAWGELMNIYPESEYEFRLDEPIPEGGYEVFCDLTIKDGDKSLRRHIWLPVMDYKNNAIVKPTVSDLSDTRMRCLVKAMAMCGLGHYIYAGEDLPSKDKQPMKRVNRQQVQEYMVAMLAALDNEDATGMKQLMDELRDTPEQMEVWKLFNTKQKTAMKTLVNNVAAKDESGE